MGSKSKSKSSTTTNQTDSRQFRSVEQGLTDEATASAIELQRGGKVQQRTWKDNDINNSKELSGNSRFEKNVNRVVANSGSNLTVTDGGAIRAVENVAGFAINAATGGAFDLAMKAGELASMISENAAASQRDSYQAVESILAEKQSDGEQDNQKTLLYVVGAVGVAAALAMGAKAK